MNYHRNLKYWDRQAWANNVDTDQLSQNATQSQQFLDTSTSGKMNLFKF